MLPLSIIISVIMRSMLYKLFVFRIYCMYIHVVLFLFLQIPRRKLSYFFCFYAISTQSFSFKVHIYRNKTSDVQMF